MRWIAMTVLVPFFLAAPFAHLPLAGMPLQTFAHGILPGVGHPLLGFDHLFFVMTRHQKY